MRLGGSHLTARNRSGAATRPDLRRTDLDDDLDLGLDQVSNVWGNSANSLTLEQVECSGSELQCFYLCINDLMHSRLGSNLSLDLDKNKNNNKNKNKNKNKIKVGLP